MQRHWAWLDQYGKREYKFVQRDSYRPVLDRYPKDYQGGVCMGVAMNWIQEKLTTSNGLLRSKGPLFSAKERKFSNSVNPITRIKEGLSPSKDSLLSKFMKKGNSGERNQEAMLQGAHSQQIYMKRDLRTLALELGLVDSSYDPVAKHTKGIGGIPERHHAGTIAKAAVELPKGTAMLIELSPGADSKVLRKKKNRPPSPYKPRVVRPATDSDAESVSNSETGERIVPIVDLPDIEPDTEPEINPQAQPKVAGHSIAFYRSRGGVLYFFDPNTGAYAIPKAGDQAPSLRDDVLVARGSDSSNSVQAGEERETNAERFVKRWLAVYEDADDIYWETPAKHWSHTYSHAFPRE